MNAEKVKKKWLDRVPRVEEIKNPKPAGARPECDVAYGTFEFTRYLLVEI